MPNNLHTSAPLIGLLLIAAACSQQEAERADISGPGGRIEFKVSLPNISSRASETTTESLSRFQVSAFIVGTSSEKPYFTDMTYLRDSETGRYICRDPKCIWPNNNDLLRFAAFTPSCEDMIAAGGAATLSTDRLTGFKVAEDIASQFDFLTAIASGKLYDDEDTGITLKFYHQLSRIYVKAWGNPSDYDLEIAGVRFGGIATGGTFILSAPEATADSAPGGSWESVTKGSVQYIFKAGDKTVTLDGTDGTANSKETAVPILGEKIGGGNGYANSAMVVPSKNTVWDYINNAENGAGHAEGMYVSVLLRVTEHTPDNTQGCLIYPYVGYAEDKNTVYLAVDKEDGKTVKTRLYAKDDTYFIDPDCTQPYFIDDATMVKPYAWAAIPVADELRPGRMYTYTLNYSGGVGLRDPNDSNPGSPIVDKVLFEVEVEEWLPGGDTELEAS